MDQDHQLDLTSEALPVEPTPGDASGKHPTRPVVRVYFGCCRLYVALAIPEGVRQKKLKRWKFHCPRCAQGHEIALEWP